MYDCKPCGGGAWCTHGVIKKICKKCDGSTLCKTPLCETQATNRRYKGHCLRCFVHLFPDEPIVRNHKTKESTVVMHMKETFPNVTWVYDRQIEGGCSRRRPDLFLDMGSHIVIMKVDENKHDAYDYACENRRLMEISQDLNHRHIVMIHSVQSMDTLIRRRAKFRRRGRIPPNMVCPQ